jgi:hypothetical protein
LLQSLLNLLDFRADALPTLSGLHHAREIAAASHLLNEFLDVLNSRSQPANSFYFHRRFLFGSRLPPLAIEN